MKEYLNYLRNIKTQIEQINSIDNTSIELNSTATQLDKDLEPCLQEIKSSLSKLQILLKPCYETLAEGENVCESKINICNVDTLKVVEYLGKLTSKKERINKLAKTLEPEISSSILEVCNQNFEQLKQEHFRWDERSQKFKREHLKIFQKGDFSPQLNKSINHLAVQIKEKVREKIQLIYQEINIFDIDILTHCLNSLDSIRKLQWQEKINLIQENLQKHFDNPTKYLPDFYSKNYEEILNQLIDNLHKESSINKLFRLYMKDFDQLHEQVKNLAIKLVENIVSQKANLAIEAFESMIYFYNYFLENQSRYQDELVSQNQIEKSWLEMQKSELDKINLEISSALESFN